MSQEWIPWSERTNTETFCVRGGNFSRKRIYGVLSPKHKEKTWIQDVRLPACLLDEVIKEYLEGNSEDKVDVFKKCNLTEDHLKEIARLKRAEKGYGWWSTVYLQWFESIA